MTVTYSQVVSRAAAFGFLKLLFRWKGSIYKLLYMDALVFLIFYYSIALIYRIFLTESQQRIFERQSLYCREFTSVVPITFILGFYVSLLAKRWWDKYLAIPWPDRVVLMIGAYVQGKDEQSRILRRTLARYLELSMVLLFRCISPVIKTRFPTIDHVEEAGLLNANERKLLESTPSSNGLWWIPCSWFSQLLMKGRKEGRIVDDYHLKSIMDEMLRYRSCLGKAWDNDWITVPLVYTQVATISVYSFFAACLVGRQFLYATPSNDRSALSEGDYYFPFFTFFQFFFYMGWLKVAEVTFTPYGEYDDDFELNWIVDRNLNVGLYTVDDLHGYFPPLRKDAFWNDKEAELPYTTAAAEHRTQPFLGSAVAIKMNAKAMEWVRPEAESGRSSAATVSSPKAVKQVRLPALLRGVSRQPAFGSQASVNSSASALANSQLLAKRLSKARRHLTEKNSITSSQFQINFLNFMSDDKEEDVTSSENVRSSSVLSGRSETDQPEASDSSDETNQSVDTIVHAKQYM